jgi:copper chaperone
MSKTTAVLTISGMSCGHCVKTVRGALEDSKGIEVVEVEIGEAKVLVDTDTEDLDLARQAVDDTGFEVVGVSVQ